MKRYINKPAATGYLKAIRIMGLVATIMWVARGPVLASENRGNNRQVQPVAPSGNKQQQDGAAGIRVVPGHRWLPPFGLERVGLPLKVEVTLPVQSGRQVAYFLVAYAGKKETRRIDLAQMKNVQRGQKLEVELDCRPSTIELVAQSPANGMDKVVSVLNLTVPPIEAEAEVRPETEVNPVDLGAIFVPHNWLLLEQGQVVHIRVAALSCSAAGSKSAEVVAWFGSSPRETASRAISFSAGQKSLCDLLLKHSPCLSDADSLHIRINDSPGHVVWKKDIRVMLARQKASWPVFGATETKLRYGPPISVRNSDSTFTSLDYNRGWDKSLNDVVVSLPNGSRFVFWRGSNYVPFWASKYNTGICYEWAETSRKDAVDCVEPLMDKELRYGRVKIMESTPARVHVRWSYQSCDFNYKVWGDKVVEDYYFYPDGYGTRVLTLESEPGINYELSEFIIITPQGAVPFSVLPNNLVDILFTDGEKREIIFPYDKANQEGKLKSRGEAAIFRARLHKDEKATAIYYCPADKDIPQHIYAPFHDSGFVVTPCYWGSHWPLSRGQTTCWSISDLVNQTPAANSILTWDIQQSAPLRDASYPTINAKGQSAFMRFRTYAWLIGFNSSPDSDVIRKAMSFACAPSVSVIQGGQPAPEPYSPERASIAIEAEAPEMEIALLPVNVCINPVVEISGWEGKSIKLWVDGSLRNANSYAWDGKVLWIQGTFSGKTLIRVSAE